jgi:hypothetical protein
LALTPGTRLGPHEVTAQIGVGGMGEVCRTTDTNLRRPVAIKVVPKAFAQDADRLARFERQAKTLASLTHTNIAGIYGLERSHGTTAVSVDVLDLNAALTRLAAFDPARRAQILRGAVTGRGRRSRGDLPGDRRAGLAGRARLAVERTAG